MSWRSIIRGLCWSGMIATFPVGIYFMITSGVDPAKIGTAMVTPIVLFAFPIFMMDPTR